MKYVKLKKKIKRKHNRYCCLVYKNKLNKCLKDNNNNYHEIKMYT